MYSSSSFSPHRVLVVLDRANGEVLCEQDEARGDVMTRGEMGEEEKCRSTITDCDAYPPISFLFYEMDIHTVSSLLAECMEVQ